MLEIAPGQGGADRHHADGKEFCGQRHDTVRSPSANDRAEFRPRKEPCLPSFAAAGEAVRGENDERRGWQDRKNDAHGSER